MGQAIQCDGCGKFFTGLTIDPVTSIASGGPERKVLTVVDRFGTHHAHDYACAIDNLLPVLAERARTDDVNTEVAEMLHLANMPPNDNRGRELADFLHYQAGVGRYSELLNPEEKDRKREAKAPKSLADIFGPEEAKRLEEAVAAQRAASLDPSSPSRV